MLLSVPITSALLMVDELRSWPKDKDTGGGEELVMQGEFRSAQDRNREIQQDIKAELTTTRITIYDLQIRQTRSEEFQKRLEEKFDMGMKILWTMCSLLSVQVIIPLIKLGLRRELLKIGTGEREAK